jgi:hypothetical protein
MTTPDQTAAAPPSLDLHAAIRRQSWTWLEAIVRRLNLSVELVDERGLLCPPLVTLTLSGPLRRVLSGAMPTLRAALSAAASTAQRQRAAVEGLDIFCVPLTSLHPSIGVLVLARNHAGAISSTTTPSDAEIDAAACWLARAIEAQLDVRVDDEESFDRVSSLHRLLHEAVDRGVERDVLVTFTEALIAWDNVEVRAYLEDVHGRFALSVATPGVDRLHPSTVAFADRSILQQPSGLARLANAEAVRLGFRGDKDVMVARLGTDASRPWLIVLCGGFFGRDEARMGLYVDLLREAIGRVAMIAETRTSWAILQQLLAAAGSVEATGEAALGELSRAVDAGGAALVVTAPNGVHTLSLGDGDAFSTSDPPIEFDQLVSTQPVLDAQTMVLAVRRPHGQAFTRRDQQLLDRAAATFAAWLPGVLRQPGHDQERRTENRDFDGVLDRVAARTIADGLNVVVLVVLAPGVVSRPGLLHKWVAEIRGQLRASDLAGGLSDREIGVLLSGTTPDQLAAVRSRILRRVTVPDAAGAPTPVTIGVASHSADKPIDGSLVRLARENATRRTAGGVWP